MNRLSLIVIALSVGASVPIAAETHRFVPQQFYNTYSFAHPPALHIKPGDRVVTKTIDAAGVDRNGQQAGTGPDPQTGPVQGGDGHARQGEGEVAGTGLETSLDVEFTIDLIKKKAIGWPRLEQDTHIMVLGSARPLLEAFQHATSELQRWLMADYGFTERGAQAFMGQASEYEIANVVDPNFTVVAKIRKTMLPRR